MFKNGPYAAFDADGVPTQNDKGVRLKSHQAGRQWEAQKLSLREGHAEVRVWRLVGCRLVGSGGGVVCLYLCQGGRDGPRLLFWGRFASSAGYAW